MIYHIDTPSLTIIAGPFMLADTYVRKLTRCGNPEVFSESELIAFGLVPEVRPALGEHQSYGDPIVTADAVTFPIIDWTAEQIAAHEAQAVLDRRSTMTCTPRQARLALAQSGLLSAVQAWIDAADEAVRIEWEYALEIRRDWPALSDAADDLGLSDSQLDGLFVLAATF